MALSEEIFRRSEELHYRMLQDLFFTDLTETQNYTLVWHDSASDYYSNLAGKLAMLPEAAPQTLAEIKRYFAERRRQTTICLTPFSEPKGLQELLKRNGFEPVYHDAWMYFEGDPAEPQLPAGVSIKTISDVETMRVFVDTFNRAYSGADAREPYGKAPPEWGETLLKSFGAQRRGRQVDYYLLCRDSRPASVLLTSAIDNYAGIYSIGTIPEMRGQGLASVLTLYAVRRLMERGEKVIFLQTEERSYNQKLYSSLGFATRWVAEAWSRGI